MKPSKSMQNYPIHSSSSSKKGIPRTFALDKYISPIKVPRLNEENMVHDELTHSQKLFELYRKVSSNQKSFKIN